MEIISPKMDVVFRELMEDDEVRLYFISDVLDLPVEKIRETRLGNPFLRKRLRGMKQGILDVKVYLLDGTRINIEMQLRRQKFWEKRSLYYLAKMFVDVLFVGQDFSRLRRCIGISILDFNLTEDDRYHKVYRMRDEQGMDYSDLLELHILELRKTLKGDKRIDDWIRLFNVRTEEDLDMIKTKNTGIERAKYVMREMSLSESFREMVEYYRKKRMDRKAEDAYVYDQGKQEGRQEGERIGQERGEQIGQERGERIGQERGQQIMLFKLVANGNIDLQTASEQSGMTEPEFKRKMEEAGYQFPR
ncbi:MAG: Rpn family recombination-promoting nuclease/putative transposase [Lachnospiraceae bacterium]|nr:Rpn family recombination-promoting nuclease/putative transposase [Lachnospiraceae bacterium]